MLNIGSNEIKLPYPKTFYITFYVLVKCQKLSELNVIPV